MVPAPSTAARFGLPHPQAALDLVRLRDALLDHGDRLEQHADVLQPAAGTLTMNSASST